jgi:hypothetical protein
MARKKPTAAQIEALDGLARHAIAEHEAGRTKPLRQFAAEHGIPLDPPPHRVKVLLPHRRGHRFRGVRGVEPARK